VNHRAIRLANARVMWTDGSSHRRTVWRCGTPAGKVARPAASPECTEEAARGRRLEPMSWLPQSAPFQTRRLERASSTGGRGPRVRANRARAAANSVQGSVPLHRWHLTATGRWVGGSARFRVRPGVGWVGAMLAHTVLEFCVFSSFSHENPVLCMHEFIQNSATRFISCNFTRNSNTTRLRTAAPAEQVRNGSSWRHVA
jgi:hypothetical protein